MFEIELKLFKNVYQLFLPHVECGSKVIGISPYLQYSNWKFIVFFFAVVPKKLKTQNTQFIYLANEEEPPGIGVKENKYIRGGRTRRRCRQREWKVKAHCSIKLSR